MTEVSENGSCSLNNVHDLRDSRKLDEQLTYIFLISLLDQLFGKHDNIRIDLSTETEFNHGLILLHWLTIKQTFKVASSVKHKDKLVRQTLFAIVNYLNRTYQFTQPIRFEHQRHDPRDKETGKTKSVCWTELNLI
jgi:hypothetical protein